MNSLTQPYCVKYHILVKKYQYAYIGATIECFSNTVLVYLQQVLVKALGEILWLYCKRNVVWDLYISDYSAI